MASPGRLLIHLVRRLAVRPVRSPWLVALVAAAVLTVIRNLAGLDSAPQGAYVDETSIGYNAWAISTHAVDEHGAHLPLYFTAFGEYKNPVYVYVLSAFLRVLPLTVTTERLPAAIFGLLTCLFITLIAWRRSRSLPLTTLVLALAALTPWLTVESRVGFEVISIVAVVSGALLCLVIAQDRRRWGWYAAAGTLLGIAVFAYSTGRVAVVLLAIALVVAYGTRPKNRSRWWMITLVPVVAAYGVLVAWSAQHPGAITARFNAINIWSDGASIPTVAGRFLANYFTYFGPDFLFVSGDHNVRHNTQFSGMLLWIALPLLLAGLVAAWRHRDQPLVRFTVLGLLVAPVSAALTNESVPHAVRAAVMLPFLLVLCVEGMVFVADHTGGWRQVRGRGCRPGHRHRGRALHRRHVLRLAGALRPRVELRGDQRHRARVGGCARRWATASLHQPRPAVHPGRFRPASAASADVRGQLRVPAAHRDEHDAVRPGGSAVSPGRRRRAQRR